MEIIPATGTLIDTLHEVVMDAYSDYVVPFNLDLPVFAAMLEQRGFAPELSFLAREEGRINGFWLAGRSEARPGFCYAISVGARVSARRRGHARACYEAMNQAADAAGLTHLILEVIDRNEKAVQLYEGLGYERQRHVTCLKGPPSRTEAPAGVSYVEANIDEVERFAASIREWQPTWQNEVHAMSPGESDVRATFAIKGGQPIAYGFFNALHGQVYQIAVASDHRRQRIASGLLSHWRETCDRETFAMVNIQDTDESTIGFLKNLGWQETIAQFEMVKTL